jgi:hypothetical protein
MNPSRGEFAVDNTGRVVVRPGTAHAYYRFYNLGPKDKLEVILQGFGKIADVEPGGSFDVFVSADITLKASGFSHGWYERLQ